jgi:hypothetical protein
MHYQADFCWKSPTMYSLDIDNDPDARKLCADKVDVFPDEVGTLLKFKLNPKKAGIPEYAEAWVGVRDSKGNFVKGREPFVDDDGDFLTNAEIENGEWAVYIPTGALKHDSEGVYTVCSVIVSDDPEDQDYGLVTGVVSHGVMIPAPRKWDVVEWLRPITDLCAAMAKVSELSSPEEFRMLADNFIDWFEYDGVVDADKLADAFRNPSQEDMAEAAMSIPLRMPELMPENVVVTLLSLFDVPLENADRLEGTAKAESNFVKKVADLYGIRGNHWKDLVASYQDVQVED